VKFSGLFNPTKERYTDMSYHTIENVLCQLENVKKTTEGYMSSCPCHNDSTPSLSIKEDNGKIILHCFGGCTYEEIAKKLKLKTKVQSTTPQYIFSKSEKCNQQIFKSWLQKRHFGIHTEKALSILNQYEIKHNKYNGVESLIIPLYDTSKSMVSIQQIAISDKLFSFQGKELSKKFPKGCTSKGIISLETESKECFIVESFANALSLFAIGYSSICIFSVSNKNIIKDIKTDKELILWFDKGVEDIQEAVAKSNNLSCIEFKNEEKGFDVNDLLARSDVNFKTEVDSYIKAKHIPKDMPTWIAVNKNGIEKVLCGNLAECIIENIKNAIYVHPFFRKYNGAIWQEIHDLNLEVSIQKEIYTYNKNYVSDSLIKNVFNQIKRHLYTETTFDSNKNLICLKNGVYDIENKVLKSFCPEYYQSIQMPFDYDKEAKCPTWTKFMNQLKFKDSNTILRLQEWFGYCLIPDTRLELCLFLKGNGGNGKGTYLKTLLALIGKDNSSAIEISKLFSRFALREIQGKLVNICTEISTQKVLSEEFKKVVSGELCTVDVKNKDHLTFEPFAKYLFSANHFIPTKDRSKGFYRRFDIVEFKLELENNEKDTGLLFKIKKELSGIFNWSLEGLYRLLNNDWKMTDSLDFQEAKDIFELESNPLKIMIKEDFVVMDIEYLEKKDIPCEEWESYIKTNSISKNDFKQHYVDYCNENRYIPLNEVHLGREMQSLGFKPKQIRDGVLQIRIYFGLKKLCNK